MKATAPIALGAAAALSLVTAGAAQAAHDGNPSPRVASYSYSLDPVQAESVPNSQATGSTRVKALPNGKVQVKVTASGLMPNAPHAMHLHGVDGPSTDMGCPGPAQDADGDGYVTVVEGIPSYGGILTSLTTTGDISAASALALDRFAVADEDGTLEYTRTFSQDAALANADTVQVVVHGIDINGNGAYDFEAGPSSLTDAAPLEATIPVLCGGIAN
ncbi:hypothetical protein KC207_00215 [Phycicoccus sp. BSK3Z-2]|uniref:CHRD domain-containing protein n=1 Tax=Phycicoccus avicenniae TaxID=2828860 RepID=A0A941D548_9MICO|nr:hypothetical protein [Phycicoccus avicenniae]MBR7741718.1 hypothetical protein [Phycicoccus avicenniae]